MEAGKPSCVQRRSPVRSSSRTVLKPPSEMRACVGLPWLLYPMVTNLVAQSSTVLELDVQKQSPWAEGEVWVGLFPSGSSRGETCSLTSPDP